VQTARLNVMHMCKKFRSFVSISLINIINFDGNEKINFLTRTTLKSIAGKDANPAKYKNSISVLVLNFQISLEVYC
jgi:hypothetical protein